MNFGADLLIVDGDVVWEGDNLSTVSGIDNVQQQAYLRAMTTIGESIFYKDYGAKLLQYSTLPFTDENKSKIEAEAKEMLLQVGNAQGQGGWIERVLECRLELVILDGKQGKRLFAKYVIRGEAKPRTMNFTLEGV